MGNLNLQESAISTSATGLVQLGASRDIQVDTRSTILAPNLANLLFSAGSFLRFDSFVHPNKNGGSISFYCGAIQANIIMLQAGTYSVTMHGVLSISELYCYNSIPTQISTFLLSPATNPAIASTIAVGIQVTGACNIQGWYRSGGNMIFEDNMETNAELSASRD